MTTFPEMDRLKATLDQHRPLDPAIVCNLREDPIVRWTYHSNAIEGNTLTQQELSRASIVLDASASLPFCEFFHKQTCRSRTICESIPNRPATPLASLSCAPGRVLYLGGTDGTSKRWAVGSPQPGQESPAPKTLQIGAEKSPLQDPSAGGRPTFNT